MSSEFQPTPLIVTEFKFEGELMKLVFVETVIENDTVKCDVYSVEGDDSKDLGIIRIDIGGNTPLQKVLEGERTVEGLVSGKGKLLIHRASGETEIHLVGGWNKQEFSIDIGIGDKMQWHADSDSELVAFEVCIPPYGDGRYENIT